VKGEKEREGEERKEGRDVVAVITGLSRASPVCESKGGGKEISIPFPAFFIDIHTEIASMVMLASLTLPFKASGPYEIPGRLLNEGAPWLGEAINKLFTLSLQTGTLSRDWIRANITPVFKKGDKHEPSNYQLVSLTSLVVKC